MTNWLVLILLRSWRKYWKARRMTSGLVFCFCFFLLHWSKEEKLHLISPMKTKASKITFSTETGTRLDSSSLVNKQVRGIQARLSQLSSSARSGLSMKQLFHQYLLSLYAYIKITLCCYFLCYFNVSLPSLVSQCSAHGMLWAAITMTYLELF